MSFKVHNQAAAPELLVPQQDGFFAWLPHNDDNGLGFGQGSTDGVRNTYGRRGFHRPQLPEVDRATRRRFNLRGYRGAESNWGCGWPYACHYDPEPFYQEKKVTPNPTVWSRHPRSCGSDRSDSAIIDCCPVCDGPQRSVSKSTGKVYRTWDHSKCSRKGPFGIWK